MPYEKRERQTDRTKKLGTLYSFIIRPVRLSIQLFGESYCPLLKFIDPNHLHQLEVHISASNPLLHFTTPVAYFNIVFFGGGEGVDFFFFVSESKGVEQRQPHLQCCNMTDNRKQSRHYYCYSLVYVIIYLFFFLEGGLVY